MAKNGKGKSAKNSNGANLGFEATLWQAADKTRGHMDAAEYKHFALGLIFLKYIPDAFAERHRQLLAEVTEPPPRSHAQTASTSVQRLSRRCLLHPITAADVV